MGVLRTEGNSVVNLLGRILTRLTDGITTTIAAGDIEIGAVELKNGTDDTRGTVLAASTSAVATDTSLVVALSPNTPVVFPTGAHTWTSSSVTDDNTITAGAYSLMLTTSSDFTGNINGVAANASTTYSATAQPGKTLPAVAYTTTTGSIRIDKMI